MGITAEPSGEIMNYGGVVYLESGISPEVVRELVKKGHKISHIIGSFGGYQGIFIDIDKGIMYGGSESQTDGCEIGY